MIALFDPKKTLYTNISSKIENEHTYNITTEAELISVITNKLDCYTKILVNYSSIKNEKTKDEIISLIDTPTKRSKILLYEIYGSVVLVANSKLLSNKNSNKSEENLKKNETISSNNKSSESIEDVFAKIKSITSNKNNSKYKHITVGVSTGGPVTLETFLPLFPQDLNTSIVVVQHILKGNYLYDICDRLNTISQMKVKVAEHGEILKNGVVYFAPPGVHLYYKKNEKGEVYIHLAKEYLKRGNSSLFDEKYKFVHIPSVDIAMESASDIFKDSLIGVILTGMGSDGAIALKYAKDNGAYTLSESEETAIIYGMPRVAYEKGGSMEVLKHYLIPNRILELLKYKI